MAKTSLKTCRCKSCNHESKIINIETDEYKKKGSKYFHKDCYDRIVAEEEAQKRKSADMQLIKNLWIENVNQTVVISYLFKILNELLDRGISSDYLVFVMQYIVRNNCKLNHPPGFKYYVDNEKIKAEYRKKQITSIPKEAFTVVEPQDETIQSKISIPKKKNGFGSIIKGG